MSTHFISEAIKPKVDAIDTSRMAVGEPGFPTEFVWREKTVQVDKVLRTWRETGPCHHGSGEMYVRKHWFEVKTTDGRQMKIYFERQVRPGASKKDRWWLFSVEE